MRFIVNLVFALVFALVLAVVLTLGVAEVSMAQQGGPTLDEVVKRIKSERNVRVLSAERVTVEGRPMYRIKVLTGDGRVKSIWVNAGG
jgi:uncharacterized membrane protein YkoI